MSSGLAAESSVHIDGAHRATATHAPPRLNKGVWNIFSCPCTTAVCRETRIQQGNMGRLSTLHHQHAGNTDVLCRRVSRAYRLVYASSVSYYRLNRSFHGRRKWASTILPSRQRTQPWSRHSPDWLSCPKMTVLSRWLNYVVCGLGTNPEVGRATSCRHENLKSALFKFSLFVLSRKALHRREAVRPRHKLRLCCIRLCTPGCSTMRARVRSEKEQITIAHFVWCPGESNAWYPPHAYNHGALRRKTQARQTADSEDPQP